MKFDPDIDELSKVSPGIAGIENCLKRFAITPPGDALRLVACC